jgi:hypothetical protein
MKDTRAYCFGRFLIDLPKAAEVNGQAYEFMFGKIESERISGGADGFAKKMKEREADLRAGKDQDDFTLTDSRTGGISNAKIFKLSLQLFKNMTYGFETYRWLNNGVVFSMRQTAFSANKIDSVLQRLETRLLPNLRYRRADGGAHPEEIPNDPGFCIKDGFITDDGKTPQYEDAGISFKFKQWPDVSIVVSTRTNGDKLQEPLLARLSKPIPAELAEAEKEMKTLRKGKRVVRSWPGEEALETYPTGLGYNTQRFTWETLGEKNSTLTPYIHVDFKTGNGRSINQRYMPPSLTDKQAIELFDAIVNSIRLRPTNSGKSSNASSPDAPSSPQLALGSRVSSAANCPQSGMWECAVNTLGVEQTRRFIEAGQPMPYGYARSATSGLRGLLGAKEDDPVEIVWTLAAYAQDKP